MRVFMTHKWLFAPRGTGFLWGRTDAWSELCPTIPTFDPQAPETWAAWMNRETVGTNTERIFLSYHSNAGSGTSDWRARAARTAVTLEEKMTWLA